MQKVWLSEFTHKRLEAHMQMKFPPILTDDRGFRLIEMNEKVIQKATTRWPGNADTAINFAISHNERSARLRATSHGSGPEAA